MLRGDGLLSARAVADSALRARERRTEDTRDACLRARFRSSGSRRYRCPAGRFSVAPAVSAVLPGRVADPSACRCEANGSRRPSRPTPSRWNRCSRFCFRFIPSLSSSVWGLTQHLPRPVHPPPVGLPGDPRRLVRAQQVGRLLPRRTLHTGYVGAPFSCAGRNRRPRRSPFDGGRPRATNGRRPRRSETVHGPRHESGEEGTTAPSASMYGGGPQRRSGGVRIPGMCSRRS
jgi:hypothetical protein